MMRRFLAVVAVAAFVAAGCTNDEQASDNGRSAGDETTGGPAVAAAGEASALLAEAAAATFDLETWGWELAIDVDEAALASLGDPDPAVTAGIMDGLRVRGVVEPAAGSMSVDVGEIQGAFEARVIEEEGVFARARVAELAALVDAEAPDPAPIVASIRSMQLDPSIEDFVTAAFAGEWVGLTGLDELQDDLEQELGEFAPDVSPSVDPDAIEQLLRDAFGATPEEFLERHATITEQSSNGETVLEVSVRLRELVSAAMDVFAEAADELGPLLGGFGRTSMPTDDAALDEIPDVIFFTVTVRDGMLAEVRIDIVAIAQAAGEDVDGTFEIVLSFDHDPESVSVPDGVTVVTGETLQATFEAVMQQMFSPFMELSEPAAAPIPG